MVQPGRCSTAMAPNSALLSPEQVRVPSPQPMKPAENFPTHNLKYSFAAVGVETWKEAEQSAADSQTTKSCWQLLRSQPWASAQGAQHLICQVLGTHHFPVSSEVRIPRNMSYVLSVLLPQHRGCITPDRIERPQTTPCLAGRGAEGEEARFTSLNKAKQAGLVFCS